MNPYLLKVLLITKAYITHINPNAKFNELDNFRKFFNLNDILNLDLEDLNKRKDLEININLAISWIKQNKQHRDLLKKI